MKQEVHATTVLSSSSKASKMMSKLHRECMQPCCQIPSACTTYFKVTKVVPGNMTRNEVM